MRALVGLFALGWWANSWALGATLAGLAYTLECWWFPYGTCLRCRGKCVYRSRFSKGTRKCRRCGGSGERLRVGRRLVVSWRGLSAE